MLGGYKIGYNKYLGAIYILHIYIIIIDQNTINGRKIKIVNQGSEMYLEGEELVFFN